MSTRLLQLYLLIAICFMPFLAIASSLDSLPTFVFRLPAERAAALYQGDTVRSAELPYLSLVDSFRHPNQARVWAQGHYLYMQPDGEQLSFSIRSFHQHDIHLWNDGKKLRLQVLDTLGKPLSDARLILDDKEIPFDAKTALYQRKAGREGFLRVYTQTDTLFYQIDADQNTSAFRRRMQRIGSRKVVYYVATPYRLVKNTYHYFKRGIGYGNWRWQRQFWKRWAFWTHPRPMRGYLATNQPKYRPGDTLRISAFATHPKGRPWNKPLELEVSHYNQRIRRYQTILKETIDPDGPGRYSWNMLLADSLQLDQDYSLILRHPKREKVEELSSQFRLEDYELEDFTFSLESTQDIFKNEEVVRLLATAEDSNGQPVYGTQMEVAVLMQNIHDPQLDSLLIPDTLWQDRIILEDQLETGLILPDSIFPDARVNLFVTGLFISPSGETEQRQVSITVNKPRQYFSLKLEQDSVWGESLLNGLSVRDTLQLVKVQGGVQSTQDVITPFKLPLSSFVSAYYLKDDQVILASISLQKEQSLVNVSSLWEQDSLWINVNNPRRIPIKWQLYNSSGQIASGTLLEQEWLYQKAASGNRYWFKYQYLWGMKLEEIEKEINPLKNMLRVDVQAPAQIFPGETSQMAVQVKRHNGKPAKNVNLTTAAYTARFEEGDPVEMSDILYRRKREPFVRYTYHKKEQSQGKLAGVPLDKYWADKMGLDHWLYYRMRYAEVPVFAERQVLELDDSTNYYAQFAPFVVKKGKQQPIFMIYLDDQLIYYSSTTDATPYSFVAEPGKHKLSLRGSKWEFRTEIELDTAEHVTLSYDIDKMEEVGRRISLPKYLTNGEKNLLRRSLMVLGKPQRGRPLYIWEKANQIYRVSPNRRQQIIGPFRDNAMLTFYDPQAEHYTFSFEGGFRYELAYNRDRLYEYELFPSNRKAYLTWPQLPNPGERALFFTDIKAKPPVIEKRINYRISDRLASRTNSGRIKLDYEADYVQKDSLPLAVYMENTADDSYRILHKNIAQIDRVAAGSYLLHWVYGTQEVRSQAVLVRDNHTSFLRLNPDRLPRGVVPDSLTNRLWKMQKIAANSLSQVDNTKPQLRPRMNQNPHGVRLVSGYIKDDSGEALIGATILVKGTNMGTVTDIDGYYEIWMPEGANDIVISYTGFDTYEVSGAQGITNVELSTAINMMEVVVTGYNVPLIEQDNTSSGMAITSADIQNLPTRNINGLAVQAAGVSVGNEAVVIRGSRSDAAAYYVDGVRTTSGSIPDSELEEELRGAKAGFDLRPLPAGTIRDNFNDHAYFQPHLSTDENGMAYFQVTFPDDITAWRHYAAAADRHRRVGLGHSQTQAYLPLQAQLSLPRFLVEGDRSEARGRVSNFMGDSIQINTFFKDENGQTLQSNRVGVRTGFAETMDIEAGSPGDSLRLVYGLEYDQFTDGEDRAIGIYRKGRERTLGSFFAFAQDTVLRMDFDPQKGPVKVELMDNGLSILTREIEYLRDYPWGCTEQTASRLIALLAEKKIARVRGEDYPNEDLIRSSLTRLRKLQNNGGWGWFAGNRNSDWISLHVIHALEMAAEADYKVEQAITDGKRYLLSRVPAMEPAIRLRVLLQFAEWKQMYDYETFLPGLDTLPWEGYDRLALLRLQQITGDTIEMDTLWKYQHKTLLGGSYWGENRWWSWAPRREVIAQTLLAYRILGTAGETKAVQSIQQYLLAGNVGRPPELAGRIGYNTLESADILRTLLPDLLENANGMESRQIRLQAKGESVQTITKFPAEIAFSARSASELRMQHTGTGPVFVTLSQSYFETQPTPEDKGFAVSSVLKQKGKVTDQLELAYPAQLEVTVRNEEEGAYILLQIPIPAGCSPVNRSRQSREAKREYLRDRVAIFLQELPAGEHIFRVDLEPRFSGEYTLNPAQIELMYVPVINGANGIKKVVVE